LIQYVKQEQSHGCAIAALAMILGRSYQDVLRDWPKRTEEQKWKDENGEDRTSIHTYHDFDAKSGGISFMCADAYLAENGFAVLRKFKHRSWLRDERSEWPPKPFGPLHLCDVVTSLGHMVVMLGDGEVYDPWFGTGRSLSDYEAVHSVAAVYKV
jgi:hypothetical protein